MAERASGVAWTYLPTSIMIFVHAVTGSGDEAVIEVRIGHQIEVTYRERLIAVFHVGPVKKWLERGTGELIAGTVTLALAERQITVSVSGVVDEWPLPAVDEKRIREHLDVS